MSRYDPLLDYFDWLINNCKVPVEPPEDVLKIYDELRGNNKPLFTDTGLQILEYLQSCGTKNLKAKEIGERMNVPSRKISGAMRKLATDGFVEKTTGQNPVIYNLTEKGLNFNIKEYKIIKESNYA